MANKKDRVGEERLNNQGYLMKIVEYGNAKNIVIEFQDEYKTKVNTNYRNFLNGKVRNPSYKSVINRFEQIKTNRLGEEKLNNQNCLMKIIEYNNTDDIIVEFQDEYKAKVHTNYRNYKKGKVENPYCKSVCGIGITGDKYQNQIKEYIIWQSMLYRCYSKKEKFKHPTYQDVTCCKEWLLYENFYEWLHSQENFDKWLNGDHWNIDKDILRKGNKVYSPETCCLVPHNINTLFIKCNKSRGKYPIGVHIHKEKFVAQYYDPTLKKIKYLGIYNTPEEAFFAYKKAKESYIKQVAQDERNKGNITERCYQAMMNYEVEIND
jgi:hypothetical protein